MKQALFGKRIFSECYFVTSGDHTTLRGTGEALEVEVHSLETFASKFIGSSQYISERLRSPFGSAVDPDTGLVDQKSYTAIRYLDSSGAVYSIKNIAAELKSGKKIVLMGEFGSGKSRCIMEVFKELINGNGQFPPIAINLRESYGVKKFNRLIADHLDLLGLGEYSDNVVRSIRRGQQITLLDGFDEIGSQPWSGDPNRLRETRKRSLEGVRDLIANCGNAGVFLTGREHYFSSNEEMAECLGVDLSNLLILKCPDEFSDDELGEYLKLNTTLQSVPDWMPRKPLICQLLARLSGDEVDRIESAAEGELEFFESVFDAICARETRLNPAIFKDSLKSILLLLAQRTREKYEGSESITAEEINRVFFDVTGSAPVDEAAQLLQKLPYLGRTGNGGAERIFIDEYAKDGLRGIALAQSVQKFEKDLARQKWVQPLGELGLRMLARIAGLGHDTEKFAKHCCAHANSQVGCDFVAARVLIEDDEIDYRGFSVHDGRIKDLPLVDVKISNLSINAVEIGELTIEGAEFGSVRFSDCLIEVLKGVSDLTGFMDVFVNPTVGKSEDTSSAARISELNLTNKQKTLLAIIKKLSSRRGGGERRMLFFVVQKSIGIMRRLSV
ncbi:hypothetical protein NLI96_g12962 [Meripilus lineatus]|uniref:NACHT domain-containing protein n=1 Tax=Meripilus lineatus TaxID=2056292 RepID=A0AAD5USU0_9APHY|nr:hypothetical protein NLI96_g12962 [Physisporinus lineatus]